MNPHPSGADDWRMRWGGRAFLLYGILWLPSLFAPHPPSDPSHNREFALGANTFAWRLGTSLATMSLAPLLLGLLALHARLARTPGRRWSIAGLLWTLGLTPLFLPVTGFGLFVAPAVGKLVSRGDDDAVDVMDQTFKEPFLVIPFLAGILYSFGLVLFGTGIWRSRVLPRWSGVLLGIMGTVNTISFLDVNPAQRILPALSAVTGAVFAALLRRKGNGESGRVPPS